MGAQQSSASDGLNNDKAEPCEPATMTYSRLLARLLMMSEEHFRSLSPPPQPAGTDRSPSIKKAYRKKALELHPDRNYGDVENATKKFAEVQSAYEVLSDPQERAWYDSHRESILRGDGNTTDDHFEHNVRLTSAGDIVGLMAKFNANVQFTDEANGFYGMLRTTFATLAKEEDSACDWEGLEPTNYPDFGGSVDSYETVAKPFYKIWIGFSTKKTFSWRDAYRSSDAPDRATRRLIEKENKKLRDDGIREFNDAVRSLVTFVRKRDPRYVPNSQSEADRQKILRDAATAQAARSRAANHAKLSEHVIPNWALTSRPEETTGFTESEESEVEHIECVACRKTFKSEQQYATHERSKKHIKAVQQLQREMRKENKLLNLDDPSCSGSDTPVNELEKLELESAAADPVDESGVEKTKQTSLKVDVGGESMEPDCSVESFEIDAENTAEVLSDSQGTDNEYASRQDVVNRLVHSQSDTGMSSAEIDDSGTTIATTSLVDGVDGTPGQKLGKAKAKRAKRAAQQEVSSKFKCEACQALFASNTKLFNHIKEFNHAQPVPKAARRKINIR